MSSAGQDPLEALRREVEVLRAAAARASMPEEVPEIDVGALLDKVRADADARLIGPARDLHHIGRVSLAAQPIAIRDVYSIEELLDYHDDDFVEAAYRALLRREPDAAGRDNYTRMLLEDRTSRVEVLYHLSRSPEGRQARVRVTGLWVAFAVRRLLQVPVVGRLAGTALYITRLPLLVRNLERQDVIGYRREKQLRAAIDAVAEALHGLGIEAESVAARVSALRGQLARLEAAPARSASHEDVRIVAESALDAATALAARLERQASSARDLALRLGQVDTALARKLEAGTLDAALTRERLETALRQGDRDLGAFYVAFEDRFRGSPEEIKGRVAVYLPIVREAGAGTAESLVLDIGCGRGEWLEVLRDAGLIGRGIDLNPVMVEQCRERGLAAEATDAIAYLKSRPTASLGAVTAMHVIEHLPLQQLLTLFEETARVLRPGGVAIFETPNPENLQVGACNFWYDPTHVHPLPPEVTRFMVQTQGLERAEVFRLHPYPQEAEAPDGAGGLRSRFNGFFYGPQDYAIVAYKT